MLIIHRKSIMLMHRPQTPQPGFGSITLLQKFTPHFKILDPRTECTIEKEIIVLEKCLKKVPNFVSQKLYSKPGIWSRGCVFKRKKQTVFQSIVNKIALLGLRSSRHQEVYSPPHNSAIIDTVYLPGIGTSSSRPNISLSILIHTLRRTSHL